MKLLLIFAVAAVQCWGAATFVQGKGCKGTLTTASTACSFDTQPTVGNRIVVAAGVSSQFNATTGTLSSISDNQGHTYSLGSCVTENASNQAKIHVCTVAITASSGAFTVTATHTVNASSQVSVYISEWSGISSTADSQATGASCASFSTTNAATAVFSATAQSAGNNTGASFTSGFDGRFDLAAVWSGTFNTTNWLMVQTKITTSALSSANARVIPLPDYNDGTIASACVAYQEASSATPRRRPMWWQ